MSNTAGARDFLTLAIVCLAILALVYVQDSKEYGCPFHWWALALLLAGITAAAAALLLIP